MKHLRLFHNFDEFRLFTQNNTDKLMVSAIIEEGSDNPVILYGEDNLQTDPDDCLYDGCIDEGCECDCDFDCQCEIYGDCGCEGDSDYCDYDGCVCDCDLDGECDCEGDENSCDYDVNDDGINDWDKENRMIYYTSTDGNVVHPLNEESFGSYDDNVETMDPLSNVYLDNLGVIEFRYDIKSIGAFAFQNRTNLQSITIPERVITIGTSAFENCTSLTSVTIPDSVTYIGENAFYGCTSLTSVTIPSSVTTIEDGAFNGCTSLTNVTMNSFTPPTIGDTSFDSSVNGTLHYPLDSDYGAVLEKLGDNWVGQENI